MKTGLRVFKDVKARLPRQRLTQLFAAIVNEEGSAKDIGQINLIFTTDRKIRFLNRQFRSQDRATDVLSFSFGTSHDHDGVAGEIYISVPTARRQARQYDCSLTDELLRLACHGLLHHFGYDDENAADAKMMRAREEYFLNKLRNTS